MESVGIQGSRLFLFRGNVQPKRKQIGALEMSILFDEKKKVFHLKTPHTSYVMAVADNKYLAHVYWGRKIRTPKLENALLYRAIGFSAMAAPDNTYSLDYVKQEYPTGCNTDYRTPAISVVYADGTRVCDLQYEAYRIVAGKPKLPGLPAVYVEQEEEADTLEITLTDALKQLKVILSYTVYNTMDVITRHATVVNQGTEPVALEKVMSASVDFEGQNYDFLQLSGAWGRERHIERTPLHTGMQKIESNRGASSHMQNPFLVMCDRNAAETNGNVYAMNFVYSGNFEAGIEVDQIFRPRMFMGLNSYDFAWQLGVGEAFTAPEVVMVYSDEGFGKMSRIYHRLYRTRLVRGRYRDEPRPILCNNWEATYFDFTEEKILEIAEEAKALGIELFVLDDGWFGKRDSDTCSLGDWTENRKKLPSGIAGLAEKINAMGLLFGLWFEPEMVSPDSDLYRAHPDWCIHVPGRQRTECRQQLILDLSRDEVCDYIIEAVSGVLDNAAISYVKWDMNRHMTMLGSAGLPAERQKEMAHRYMLGLYRVMETVVSSHPDILFESCSGGGGRFDPGMLYYMPQTWTSDDTDAVERLYIQYGTSMAYPISAMGSHVSAVPNHQAHRVTPLKTRGDVAMSGNFGYELDLTAFTEKEKAIVKQQIAQYKELRTFIQSGDMYRLQNPFTGNTAAWMFISEDGMDIFAAYFRIQAVVNGPMEWMKFTALDPEAQYEDLDTSEIWNGDELMEIGISMELHGDAQSRTWRFKKRQTQ